MRGFLNHGRDPEEGCSARRYGLAVVPPLHSLLDEPAHPALQFGRDAFVAQGSGGLDRFLICVQKSNAVSAKTEMLFEGRDGLRVQLARHVVQKQLRDLPTNRGLCAPDYAASDHIVLPAGGQRNHAPCSPCVLDATNGPVDIKNHSMRSSLIPPTYIDGG
jgi:hypothetical protein